LLLAEIGQNKEAKIVAEDINKYVNIILTIVPYP
jgi:hypothetical protein